MNGTVLAADLPVCTNVRTGGSRSWSRMLSEWGAQEKPPIGEPDHDIGPGPGEDDEDDEDEEDDDEDDEDAAADERPMRPTQAVPRKHAPVKEPPQPKEPPIEEPDESEQPPDGDPRIDDPDEPA